MNHKKEQRLFINKSQISKYLTCPICQDIFYDPIRLTCGHTFCKRCFNQWDKVSNGRCPMCREEYDEAYTSRDLIAFGIINDLSVLCVNKECPWKGSLVDLGNHLKNCYFDQKKMPSYVKKVIKENEQVNIKEEDEEDTKNDNSNIEFNVNSSLKARLYQKHPELMTNVFKTKNEIEEENNKNKGNVVEEEQPAEDLTSMINLLLGEDRKNENKINKDTKSKKILRKKRNIR